MDQFEALRGRTKGYASRIIKLYAYLQQEYHYNDAALIIGKQLLRSGTGCVANHREAKHSRSRADRIAKFHIVLQELEESALWLELLCEHEMAHTNGLEQIIDETNQLIAIFITSINTLKQR